MQRLDFEDAEVLEELAAVLWTVAKLVSNWDEDLSEWYRRLETTVLFQGHERALRNYPDFIKGLKETDAPSSWLKTIAIQFMLTWIEEYVPLLDIYSDEGSWQKTELRKVMITIRGASRLVTLEIPEEHDPAVQVLTRQIAKVWETFGRGIVESAETLRMIALSLESTQRPAQDWSVSIPKKQWCSWFGLEKFDGIKRRQDSGELIHRRGNSIREASYRLDTLPPCVLEAYTRHLNSPQVPGKAPETSL